MDDRVQQSALDETVGSAPGGATEGTAAPAAPADPLWYRDAVIYQVHIRGFFDSNDDGIGDLRGLTSKLDYIRELGVDTIWLQPFYPSPLRDDGYDVADYLNVHPQYGTRDDVRRLVREAHRRRLRVITELVVNHTSDRHPWFQAARRAPAGSRKRDFYVWSDSDQKYRGTRIIFTDTEPSNWTWDPVAKAWYWHRFFSHQPDLNFDNPSVLKAVIRAMRFWLDLGVDGFRLDAIPYLIEREGTSNENLPETHAVIKRIRAALDARHPNRVLLAEANQWPEDVREYFGDGDECHMAYHFPLMPRIYMAIAQEDRHPVVEIMQQTPALPANCQWAIFLRNHDELTLEMVTSRERDYMYRIYAADAQARINLGIRRRLAPLMENDPDRIKLMNSLLLSMPGSPIIYYGDEIGMGDNIFLGDRNGVRTPMQWTPDRNAGFSRADPQRLYLPPIMDAVYGYQAVNVESQTRDPSSLLNWMRRMLAVRKTSRAFGRGRLTFLRPGNRKVLAYLREIEGESDEEAILCVANMGRTAQPVELDLRRFRGRVPVELLGRTAFPPIGEVEYLMTLPAHGFYWFRLDADAERPKWHAEQLAPEDLPVLVLFDGWTSFFRERVVPWRIGMAQTVRAQLEDEILPRYLEPRRWYAAKGEPLRRARLAAHALWPAGGETWLVTVLAVEGPADPARYFVPLALAWEETEEARFRSLAPGTVAKARQQARVGVLADALFDEAFCRAVVSAIGAGTEIAAGPGRIRFVPTPSFADVAGPDPAALEVGRPQAQNSNSVVTLGERLFLKLYRRVRSGINPEREVGRFLTEVARFAHCVPVAGAVEHADADGIVTTLALLQGYVANSGDGWTWAVDYLERFLDAQRARAADVPPADAHGGFLALVQTLGTRTAALHRALALATGDPGFDPEPFGERDRLEWQRRVRAEAVETMAVLERGAPGLAPAAGREAQALLEARDRLLARIDGVRGPGGAAVKTRCHGDYHLGQVLLAQNDFVIIDFEGEPARALEERRAKALPLRDVAGMLRSFDYARATALRNVARDDGEQARLAALAAAWHAAVRSSFLAAYDQAMRAPDPSRLDTAGDLLALAELEKALYELRYELANRPAWAAIPLAAVRAAADIPVPEAPAHPTGGSDGTA